MEEISKLTPILYEMNETNFNHNGLGKLTNLLVNDIEEVLNGEFEAFFEYPANGRLAHKIDNKMLIKAKPNTKDNPHVFRVYDYELDTFNQTYLIYARSKNIDDLGGNMVLDVNVRNQAPNQAWNQAVNNALEPVNIRFESDITTRTSAHWERRNLLSIIAGQEESMIQYWGGEIKHGNGWLWLYRRRGQDNVTTVRHGKNLEGLIATYSTKGLITAIVPYYVKRGRDGADDTTIYGNTVQSQYVNNYPHVYYDTIEYNNEELGLDRDEEPENGWSNSTIRSALNRVSERYFIEHTGIDLPAINMEINLEDISKTKEYEHFKNFEQIEIGDTITVYSKKFHVHVTAKVRRVVYDGLTDMNKVVEVGTVSRSIYDDYRDLVNNRVEESANKLQEGIDHAMTSANGKNTNYYGTADPNEAGLIGQNNDSYFRTNGQLKEIWIYRDGMWHLEVGDLTGEQIRADVEQAQADIAEAKQTADEAVEQIDTAVSNAGFTSLDETISSVQSISNQAQINASTAIDNALEAMNTASLAVENTGSLNVRVDEVENTLSVKADKQTVDTLSGIVDTHTLDIQANAEGLALKANQDTVDTLAGTVSSLGTEFDIVAGQVNSRVWNTDIDNIEIGARNYFPVSKLTPKPAVGVDYPNDRVYHFNLEPETEYIISTVTNLIAFRLKNGGDYYRVNFAETNDKGHKLTTDATGMISIGFWGNEVDKFINGESLFQIEKGNKATDWIPALEDNDAKIDHIETEFTQKYDSITQSVSSLDGRVTVARQDLDSITNTVTDHTGKIATVEQNVNGIQQTVNDPVNGLVTQVSTLANGFNVLAKDFADMEIGGRNYAIWNDMLWGYYSASGVWMSGAEDGNNRTTDFISVSPGETITVTLYDDIPNFLGTGRIILWDNNKQFVKVELTMYTGWSVPNSYSFVVPNGVSFITGSLIYWGDVRYKIEKSTIATDWTPAPEDMATQAQLSVLNDNINLRVKKGDTLAQINIEAGKTLIQNDKLLIDATTTVIKGTTWIDGAVIKSASIGGSRIADATIGSAKIAYLDVNKISGNTTNFVRSTWNNINYSVSITGSGIELGGPNVVATLSSRGYVFVNDGKDHGQMSILQSTDSSGVFRGKESVSLGAEPTAYLSLSNRLSASDTSLRRVIGVINGEVYMSGFRPSTTSTAGIRSWLGSIGSVQGIYLGHSNSNKASIFFANNGNVYIKSTSGNYSIVKPNFE